MGKKRVKVKHEKKTNVQQQEESEEDQVFVVEVITAARVAEDASGWEYHVKWKGFESDDDTWEPEENLIGCEKLLSRFWSKGVGNDDDQDYHPGQEVAPTEAWIAKERRRSAKEPDSDTEDERTRKRNRHHGFSVSASEVKKEKKTTKVKNKELKNFVEALNDATGDESTDDDTPLSNLASKHATPASEGGDNSETTDQPLAAQAARQKFRKGSGLKRKVDAISGAGSSMASPSEPPRKVSKASGELSSNHGSKASFTVGKGKEKDPDPNSSPRSTHSLDSLFDASSSPPKPAIQPSAVTRKPSASSGPRKETRMIDDPRLTIGSTLPTKAMVVSKGPNGALAGSTIRKPSGLFGKKTVPPPQHAVPPRSFPSAPIAPSAQFQAHQHTPAQHTQSTMPAPPSDSAMDIDVQSGDLGRQGSLTQVLPTSHAKTSQQAEAFLAGIIPQNMTSLNDPAPPQARSNTKAGLPRFTKKFKWSGELLINTAKDRVESVGNVSLSEPTDHRQGSVRFSLFFISEEPPRELTFAKLFPMSSLSLLRPACLPPAQLAKVGPQDEKDMGPLSSLAKYMASRLLMTYATLTLDDSPVAILLVFPSSVEEMCKRLEVQGAQRSGVFVAALIPWAVPGQIARRNRTARNTVDRGLLQFPSPRSPAVPIPDRHISVRHSPAYQRALRFLDFPKPLHDFLCLPNHPYEIWHIPSDGTPNAEGFETTALRSILQKCRTPNKSIAARVFFVHIGSVRTLHRVPGLVERRRTSASLQFFTYGTHPTVPPQQWGVREIFPIGGVVTFSAGVFREQPFAIYKMITMLYQHPLWACYVTPSILAMALRDSCGSDPMSTYDREDIYFNQLLTMLEDGQISLLRQAPVNRSSAQDLDAWITGEWAVTHGKNRRDILSTCLQHFNDRYSRLKDETRLRAAVSEELSSTMSSLQLQQSIIENYRRYVVITGKEDTQPSTGDGFEWMALEDFRFGDDYFSLAEMPLPPQ